MTEQEPSNSISNTEAPELLRLLKLETRAALDRIYQLDQPTPLDSIELESGATLTLKREDLSVVHSYKWRGSFNKILAMHESGFTGKLVAASAGNHAQGVAVTAKRLNLPATIFMPRSTPVLKQESVKSFGGEFIQIQLHGDSFDEAAREAHRFAEGSGGVVGAGEGGG